MFSTEKTMDLGNRLLSSGRVILASMVMLFGIVSNFWRHRRNGR